MNVCGPISQTFVHVKLVENPQCIPNECLLGEQSWGPKSESPSQIRNGCEGAQSERCSFVRLQILTQARETCMTFVEVFEVTWFIFGSTIFNPAGL